MTAVWKWSFRTVLLLLILLTGPALVALSGSFEPARNWYDADRSSAGLAPRATETTDALVQVYGARAFGWRGYFAMHTWLATKTEGASHYLVHEVTGWSANAIRSRPGEPDRAWFGSPPRLLAELRGPAAGRAIPKIATAIAAYPYPNRYEAWPGPNSNTFTAWVTRQVPELEVAYPNTAIGKDYLGDDFFSATPSATGYQLSLFGYLGLLAGVREGLELNVLGLSIGVDPMALAIKMPGIGHLGLGDPWVQQSLENP